MRILFFIFFTNLCFSQLINDKGYFLQIITTQKINDTTLTQQNSNIIFIPFKTINQKLNGYTKEKVLKGYKKWGIGIIMYLD
ncbi:hypothetical protein SAMN05444377_1077 [Flavobacterium fontis]|uniref:Uncharacterized protein n=1 Tax=Flavobacterium fontis TaxID=1124188 RepID=A0A1M5AV28_9FLAO|nr:hypothetical protein SAMN05444377_1077 [Flavobacterium fontis]